MSRDRQGNHEVVRAKTDGNDLEVSGYRGTFPPPEIIRVLNDLAKDGAHRVLVMAESEQDHDHKIERRDQVWRGIFTILGQAFGFILGAGTIGGSIWLMSRGFSVTGFGTLFTGLALLIGTFVKSATADKKKQ